MSSLEYNQPRNLLTLHINSVHSRTKFGGTEPPKMEEVLFATIVPMFAIIIAMLTSISSMSTLGVSTRKEYSAVDSSLTINKGICFTHSTHSNNSQCHE